MGDIAVLRGAIGEHNILARNALDSLVDHALIFERDNERLSSALRRIEESATRAKVRHERDGSPEAVHDLAYIRDTARFALRPHERPA